MRYGSLTPRVTRSVDHDAEVSVGAGNNEIRLAATGHPRGVDSGGEALGGRLLVARRAIDLTSEETGLASA